MNILELWRLFTERPTRKSLKKCEYSRFLVVVITEKSYKISHSQNIFHRMIRSMMLLLQNVNTYDKFKRKLF